MMHPRFRAALQAAYALVLVGSVSACSGGGSLVVGPPPASEAQSSQASRAVGLGLTVQSRFGGDIFGWDIDQNGNGVLTESVTQQSGMVLNAIESFDQSSGKIARLVQKKIESPDIEPVVMAIAGSDAGIIDVEDDANLQRNDRFDLMTPVSGNRITSHSKTPHRAGVVPNFMTNNQASSSQVMLAYFDKRGEDVPVLYTFDTSRRVFGRRMGFPKRDAFDIGKVLYAAVDATTNEAVTGYLNRTRYNPHESSTFIVMDAATGKVLRSFIGVGYGFPNGMAIDPSTGMMCTTTTGDMDVEFYKLSSGKGKAVQIPVLFGGGAETNGAAVAADPIHHLFLVAQLNSTLSSTGGSTVIVYDEHGKIVEYINGLNFLFQGSVIVPRIALNPQTRSGYVNGPTTNQLQEFAY